MSLMKRLFEYFFPDFEPRQCIVCGAIVSPGTRVGAEVYVELSRFKKYNAYGCQRCMETNPGALIHKVMQELNVT